MISGPAFAIARRVYPAAPVFIRPSSRSDDQAPRRAVYGRVREPRSVAAEPPSLEDRTTIGDRVERAIERHADTAGEIERGEEERPHRLRRNIVWLSSPACRCASSSRRSSTCSDRGALLLTTDRPLACIGRVAQRVRNRLRRRRRPVDDLPERLLGERDRILETLGPRWKRAVLDAGRPGVRRGAPDRDADARRRGARRRRARDVRLPPVLLLAAAALRARRPRARA
jgi:hypothetical protein